MGNPLNPGFYYLDFVNEYKQFCAVTIVFNILVTVSLGVFSIPMKTRNMLEKVVVRTTV